MDFSVRETRQSVVSSTEKKLLTNANRYQKVSRILKKYREESKIYIVVRKLMARVDVASLICWKNLPPF